MFLLIAVCRSKEDVGKTKETVGETTDGSGEG